MSIETMKGEAVKGVTAAAISLFAGFIGYLVAGSFVSSALEFKIATKDSYFAIPEQMKNGLQLQLQGRSISNVSVIDIGIFNRNRDLGPTTVYFKLTPKKDKLPQLISAEIVPPENLPKIGIERVKNDDPALVGYRFATLKRQSSSESYLAKLIFEGDEAPLIQVLTNDKDVEIVSYREWRDWLLVGLVVALVYTALIVAIIIWDSKRAVKRREQLVKDFESLLMRNHHHKTPASDSPQLTVAVAAATYKRFIEPKSGFFSMPKPTAAP